MMPYLVYCIMKGAVFGVGPITGVKGKEVSFVTGHDLYAAVSEMSSVEGAPPVSELLAYGKVVEDLHRLKAVVPMRYGCFLDEVTDIQRILKEKKSQYESLLEELEGHVEMGIRILLPEQEVKRFHRSRERQPQKEEHPVNGRNYLVLRKAHYRMMDDTSQHHQMLLDRYIHAFSGLYGKYRTETDVKNGAVILSLYFLVPGSAVNRFRESFQRVVDDGSSKTLISGPWPPYNFVVPDLAPAS
jgi:hypothetical protein